jgi:putative membrane protein (TIGR04086 family)
MDIRWSAVLVGFLTDYAITGIILLLANPNEAFRNAPNIAIPEHLILIVLLTVSTGVGGYVAARLARSNHAMHGLLVGVIAILMSQLDVLGGAPNPARTFIVASAIGCLLGAMGGLIAKLTTPQTDTQPKN